MKAALPRLILLANADLDPRVVGIRAVPRRMPEVLRLPGETLSSMTARARLLVRVHSGGAGEPLAVYPILKELEKLEKV